MDIKNHWLTTHGLSKTRAYKTWYAMMARCYNNKNPNYKNYGALGIKVCPEWHDLKTFVEWYDRQDNGISIDRKDVYGDYSSENCRLVSYKIQARNRRSNVLNAEKVAEIKQLYKTVKNQREISRITGIDYRTINDIFRGRSWS